MNFDELKKKRMPKERHVNAKHNKLSQRRRRKKLDWYCDKFCCGSVLKKKSNVLLVDVVGVTY